MQIIRMDTQDEKGQLVAVEFENWIYITTGNLQHQGTPTRLVSLYAETLSAYGGNGNIIRLKTWNDAWAHEAEFLYTVCTKKEDPRILYIGYSWGAGWGGVRLAKHLLDKGIEIDRMVLIDPVYRHPYFLGNWRALISAYPITIPRNVKRVTWFRQNESFFIKGHNLRIPNGSETIIDDPIWLNIPHSAMDDSQTVLGICRSIIVEMMEADLFKCPV